VGGRKFWDEIVQSSQKIKFDVKFLQTEIYRIRGVPIYTCVQNKIIP
jgi:hypothetical protein